MFLTATHTHTHTHMYAHKESIGNIQKSIEITLTNLKPQGSNTNNQASILNVASATNETRRYICTYTYTYMHICTRTTEANYHKLFAQISDLFRLRVLASNLFICLFVQRAPTTQPIKVISWHSLLMAEVTGMKKRQCSISSTYKH